MLDRFFNALVDIDCDTVVRLTGDCPLIDPNVIHNVITAHLSSEADYTSNALNPTFPDGLDVEVFKKSALQIAKVEAYLPSHLEHATPFIYHNPERFILNSYVSSDNLGHLRWTVDEVEDFDFVTKVYEQLYSKNKFFSMKDILELLQQKPELLEVNSHINRNEGYEKSLKNDKKYLSEQGGG